MVFDRLKKSGGQDASLVEKESTVKRLKNGQTCWVKVFEKQSTWTVEMSEISSHNPNLKHSYVFPKIFELNRAISESEEMYVDFLALYKN